MKKKSVPHKTIKFPEASIEDSDDKNLAFVSHIRRASPLGQYRKAADSLIDHLETGYGAGHPENVLLPILFLYRHEIELQLKSALELAVEVKLVEPSKKFERFA